MSELVVTCYGKIHGLSPMKVPLKNVSGMVDEDDDKMTAS
jgi:hypothetical protein